MNVKAKSNSVITAAVVDSILRIEVLGAGVIEFDPAKASEANRTQAMWHGFTQRLSDKAALKAPVRQAGSTDDQWAAIKAQHTQEKYQSIKALSDYYMSGEVPWKMASTGQAAESGLLFTALCRMKPELSTTQITEFLESRTPEQLKAVKLNKRTIEQMNLIRLEKAGNQDTESALDELDSL